MDTLRLVKLASVTYQFKIAKRSFKLQAKTNEAILMRVMVSLNLADIMTATRPTTSQDLYETPDNETDPIGPDQESQLTTNSEQVNAEGVG